MNNTKDKKGSGKTQAYIQRGTTNFGFLKMLFYVFGVRLISYRKNFCLLRRDRENRFKLIILCVYIHHRSCADL